MSYPKNKVLFSAEGKNLSMKLTDKEINLLRCYSFYKNSKTHGMLYNFSVFAFMSYELGGKKKTNAFYKTFDYNNFDIMSWDLVTD